MLNKSITLELSLSKESHNDRQSDTNLAGKEQSKPRDTTTTRLWTAQKAVIFALLCFVYLLTWCCASLWCSFLPIEAAKRGVTSTEVGLIYGTYSLVAFMAALCYGPVMIPKTGPYFVLFAGLFLNGGASLICGFTDLIADHEMFAIYLFIARAVSGLGGAACETAIVVIVTNEFRENIAIAISLLRVFTGLGLIMGPVLGGGLYTLGGFRLPMVVTGGMLLAALPLVWLLLPRKDYHSEKKSEKSKRSLKQALSIPGVLVMCAAYLIGSSAISFIEPTLQPFAQTLGINPTGVGLLFLCISGTYMVCTPVIGYILHRKAWRRTFIVIGAFGIAVGFLFVGPAPFMSAIVPRKVWILSVSLGFSGIGFALFFIPVLPELLECCYERGFPKHLNTDSMVSGIYTGIANLGGFVGPVFGGIATGSVGFPWTCTIVAFIVLAKAVLLLIFFSCCRRRVVREFDPEYQRLLLTTKTITSYDTVLHREI